MGFTPSKADFDLWMRKKDDHYECVTTHVDDVLAFSRDPMSVIKEIQDTGELKGIGKPEHCLGGNCHTVDGLIPKEVDGLRDVDHEEKEHSLDPRWLKEGVKTAFSARTYIKNCVERLESVTNQTFGTFLMPM